MPTNEALYFSGLPGEELRDVLWARFLELLESGIPSDQILVLVESPTRTAWNEKMKNLPFPTGAQKIFTPAAWIQQELETWWPLVEEKMSNFPSAEKSPVFAAVDLSQYLLGTFLETSRQEGLLASAQTTPALQNGQILDALARSIENGEKLNPLEKDSKDCAARLAARISDKLKKGASDKAQGLFDEVGTAIKLYLEGVLPLRILDHALRLEIFASLLWPAPRYQDHLFKHTSHLLVENLDESSPRLQEIYASFPQMFFTLPSKPAGGLREYLGADPEGAWEKAKGSNIIARSSESIFSPLAELGKALHDGLHGEIETIELDERHLFRKLDDYAYADMLDALAGDLEALLKKTPPNEIALVAPALDPLLIWSLRDRLERMGSTLYVFAGTNRLTDYRPVRTLMTLAKICFPLWEIPPSRFELIELMEFATGLNPLQIGKLSEQLFPMGKPVKIEAKIDVAPEIKKKIDFLATWIDKKLLAPQENTEPDVFFREAFEEVYAKASCLPVRSEAFGREISQIGQLIELSERFREVDRRLSPHDTNWGKRFLAFLKANPIAERPFFKREPHQASVTLSTPNQLAEKGFMGSEDILSHLFLLDWGSERWWKSDRKELSNARVLSHRRSENFYSFEEEERDMNEKLGRILMACLLKPRERLWIYGCLTDAEGRENRGELPYLLDSILGRQKK